jgi:hypothetical protein
VSSFVNSCYCCCQPSSSQRKEECCRSQCYQRGKPFFYSTFFCIVKNLYTHRPSVLVPNLKRSSPTMRSRGWLGRPLTNLKTSLVPSPLYLQPARYLSFSILFIEFYNDSKVLFQESEATQEVPMDIDPGNFFSQSLYCSTNHFIFSRSPSRVCCACTSIQLSPWHADFLSFLLQGDRDAC